MTKVGDTLVFYCVHEKKKVQAKVLSVSGKSAKAKCPKCGGKLNRFV